MMFSILFMTLTLILTPFCFGQEFDAGGILNKVEELKVSIYVTCVSALM